MEKTLSWKAFQFEYTSEFKMSETESDLDSLLVDSECALDDDDNQSHRSRTNNSVSNNDYVICRKPTSIIQYDSSEINYHKLHASSRTTRLLRKCLLVMCLATALSVFSYVTTSMRYPSRIALLPGWNRNTTRNISEYIFPDISTTLTEPTNVCDGDENLLLLIVVCSAPGNFEKRQTIRETWANMTEFNYPMFARMHSNFNGPFLPISDLEWPKYAIRNGKANVSEPSLSIFRVKIVFLIGQTKSNATQMRIYEESEMHNDLIQESFLDTYNNLTLKTVMMLKWVNGRCVGKGLCLLECTIVEALICNYFEVRFLMKCDDDTFVNVPNLLHVLLGGTVPVYVATLTQHEMHITREKSYGFRLSRSMMENLLIGHRFCHIKPVVNVSSKWYVFLRFKILCALQYEGKSFLDYLCLYLDRYSPSYMYNEETYPNYLSGTGYVMLMDVALRLYNISLKIPLFHLEDVYLTGKSYKGIGN